MSPLSNHHLWGGRNEVVTIYPDILLYAVPYMHLYMYTCQGHPGTNQPALRRSSTGLVTQGRKHATRLREGVWFALEKCWRLDLESQNG